MTRKLRSPEYKSPALLERQRQLALEAQYAHDEQEAFWQKCKTLDVSGQSYEKFEQATVLDLRITPLRLGEFSSYIVKRWFVEARFDGICWLCRIPHIIGGGAIDRFTHKRTSCMITRIGSGWAELECVKRVLACMPYATAQAYFEVTGGYDWFFEQYGHQGTTARAARAIYDWHSAVAYLEAVKWPGFKSDYYAGAYRQLGVITPTDLVGVIREIALAIQPYLNHSNASRSQTISLLSGIFEKLRIAAQMPLGHITAHSDGFLTRLVDGLFDDSPTTQATTFTSLREASLRSFEGLLPRLTFALRALYINYPSDIVEGCLAIVSDRGYNKDDLLEFENNLMVVLARSGVHGLEQEINQVCFRLGIRNSNGVTAYTTLDGPTSATVTIGSDDIHYNARSALVETDVHGEEVTLVEYEASTNEPREPPAFRRDHALNDEDDDFIELPPYDLDDED